ncbi:hypothetical protein IAT38_001039 [Cryptococcus sp. DSM 104549]
MSRTSPIDVSPQTPKLGSPLRALSRDTSARSIESEEGAEAHGHAHQGKTDGWQGVILSPSPSPASGVESGCLDKLPGPTTSQPTNKSPVTPPLPRLPLIFRSPPALPRLDTLSPLKNTPSTSTSRSPPSPPSQTLATPHPHAGGYSPTQQGRYPHALPPPHLHQAYARGGREGAPRGAPCGAGVYPMYRPGHAHRSSLPSINSYGREYYPHPHAHPHHLPQYPHPHPHSHAPPPPPPPQPYPHAHPHAHPHHGVQRPRLQIHPYAPPAHAVPGAGDPRYYSAGPGPSQGHGHGVGLPGFAGRLVGERGLSPGSSVSPGNSFKSPRKRADDVQLSILTEVFDRTSYPTTEERDALARRLGMTSRSVQIWFQNRRRAVKVDQQSALQRAEAEARARGMSGLGPAPGVGGFMHAGEGVGPHVRGRSLDAMEVDVKAERLSPDRY